MELTAKRIITTINLTIIMAMTATMIMAKTTTSTIIPTIPHQVLWATCIYKITMVQHVVGPRLIL